MSLDDSLNDEMKAHRARMDGIFAGLNNNQQIKSQESKSRSPQPRMTCIAPNFLTDLVLVCYQSGIPEKIQNYNPKARPFAISSDLTCFSYTSTYQAIADFIRSISDKYPGVELAVCYNCLGDTKTVQKYLTGVPDLSFVEIDPPLSQRAKVIIDRSCKTRSYD